MSFQKLLRILIGSAFILFSVFVLIYLYNISINLESLEIVRIDSFFSKIVYLLTGIGLSALSFTCGFLFIKGFKVDSEKVTRLIIIPAVLFLFGTIYLLS